MPFCQLMALGIASHLSLGDCRLPKLEPSFHFIIVWNVFISFTKFIILQAIEDIGESITSWGKGTVPLNVQFTKQSIMLINLYNIYYVLFSIASLVSGSSLLRKSFYFFSGKCIFNCIFDDQKVVYISIINWLFALQVTYTSFIALFSQDSAFT